MDQRWKMRYELSIRAIHFLKQRGTLVVASALGMYGGVVAGARAEKSIGVIVVSGYLLVAVWGGAAFWGTMIGQDLEVAQMRKSEAMKMLSEPEEEKMVPLNELAGVTHKVVLAGGLVLAFWTLCRMLG